MSEQPITVLHDPGGNGEPADHLYALIVTHGPEDESLVGVPGQFGGVMPAVVLSLRAAESLLPYAQEIANATGKTLQLIRFNRGSVHRTVSPSGSDG